jgi:hypothetical protein
MKIYKHPKYYYDLESVTRFINVEYVTDINSADYVAIATSEPVPVFEGITKPILYSYVREHPYPHDEYLKIQFESLKSTQDITIFSLSSFDHFASGRKNIIIDQFELDAYHRLFIEKQCEVVDTHIGSNLRYLFLGGKANKGNRKPLYEELKRLGVADEGVCSLFGVVESPDNIEIENNHYIGYPYDLRMYKITNLSLVAETHFEHNQEFHPTEKIYRAIANKHGFIVASTPFFLNNLRKKGYETFSNHWSENYDFTKDHKDRLKQAALSLLQATKTSEYSLIKPICEHNLNTLKNNAQQTIQNILNGLVK